MKTPKFDAFSAASEKSSRIKARVKGSDTKPELRLRRALWARGLRYRVRGRELPGSPDILFPKERIAVFCDGDFWHGRDWPELQRKLQRRANPSYWIPKIKSNIHRDESQTAKLRELGWTVVRVWEGSILEDVDLVAENLLRIVHDKRSLRSLHARSPGRGRCRGRA